MEEYGDASTSTSPMMAGARGEDGAASSSHALSTAPAGGGGDALAVVRPPQENSIGVVVAGTILGNVLEWYDFSIYGAFAVEIGLNFFPSGGTGEDGGSGAGCDGGGGGGSLLATLAVFGAAFVARPVGGVLMGHIGDKMGRTLALQLSAALQGAAAIALAVLPSHTCPAEGCTYQIGANASVLLIVVRLAQGVSVGGELVGSMIYSAETAPPGRRSVLACVPLSSAFIGTAVGYLVAGVLHLSLSETAVKVWGWRLAFALGTPLAVVTVVMRRWLHESDDFTREKLRAESAGKECSPPLMRTLREQKGAIAIVLFGVALWAMVRARRVVWAIASRRRVRPV